CRLAISAGFFRRCLLHRSHFLRDRRLGRSGRLLRNPAAAGRLHLVRPDVAVAADCDLALACLFVASAHCSNSTIEYDCTGRASASNRGINSARSLPAQRRSATVAAHPIPSPRTWNDIRPDSRTQRLRRVRDIIPGMIGFFSRRTRLSFLSLALQGGGAHGAFTWGVLDRLLEEPALRIDGVSATSSGAMNALALAQGWLDGGRDGA